MLGTPVSSQVAKYEKGKRKQKALFDSKELEEHSLVKNKHRTLNAGQIEDSPWWSKGKKGKKGSSKGKNYLSESDFRAYQPDKGIRKEKARKVPIINQDFQPQKHLVKKDMVIPGNETIGIPDSLMIPQLEPQEELPRQSGGVTFEALNCQMNSPTEDN